MKLGSDREFTHAPSLTDTHRRHARHFRKCKWMVSDKRQCRRNIFDKNNNWWWYSRYESVSDESIIDRWAAFWIGEPTGHSNWYYCVLNDVKVMDKCATRNRSIRNLDYSNFTQWPKHYRNEWYLIRLLAVQDDGKMHKLTMIDRSPHIEEKILSWEGEHPLWR